MTGKTLLGKAVNVRITKKGLVFDFEFNKKLSKKDRTAAEFFMVSSDFILTPTFKTLKKKNLKN